MRLAVIKRYSQKGICPYCGSNRCISYGHRSPSGITPKDWGLRFRYGEQFCLYCERASRPKLKD